MCRCPLNRVYAYTVAPKRLHGYRCQIFSSLRGRCGVSPYTSESFYDPKVPSWCQAIGSRRVEEWPSNTRKFMRRIAFKMSGVIKNSNNAVISLCGGGGGKPTVSGACHNDNDDGMNIQDFPTVVTFCGVVSRRHWRLFSAIRNGRRVIDANCTRRRWLGRREIYIRKSKTNLCL